MRLRLLSAFIVFALTIARSEALDQDSSGYNAEGYTTSGDDEYDGNDGSGTGGQEGRHCDDVLITFL